MLIEEVENVIRQKPGVTAKQIADALFGVNGYAERVHAACNALTHSGRVRRQGSGKPNDPFTYQAL